MKDNIIGNCKIQLTDKNILQLPLIDFLESIVENLEDDKLLEFITQIGLKESLFKRITVMLAEEYTLPNYNDLFHEGRELFLENLKDYAYIYYKKYIVQLKEELNRKKQVIRNYEDILFHVQNNYQDIGDLTRFNWVKDCIDENSKLKHCTNFEEVKRLENILLLKELDEINE